MKLEGLRYANIGLGVMFAVMLIGGIALRDAGEAALQAVGAGAFFGGIAVYVLLDKRADRRKHRDQ